MQKRQKGFTLIELLVVIAIIGLLSTLAVVALTSARAKARDAKRISDVKQVQTALELYYADKGGDYPPTQAALGEPTTAAVLCSLGFTGSSSTTKCASTDTTFMGKVPRDASMKSDDAATACTATGLPTGKTACDYSLETATDKKSYKIYFVLEGDSGELKKGFNCATQNGMANACQ